MEKMPSMHIGTVLTPEDRLARRNLILRDAASLLTLFLITAVIFVLTLLLFRSFTHHRQIRLEMSRYLISRGEYSRARAQLLIAAGNAPDDPGIKLTIAGLLEQANATLDSLGIYRSLASRHEPPVAALEGAGRTAFALGMYRLANDYLGRALDSPLSAIFSDNQKTEDHTMFDTSLHVLLLDPSFDLAPRSRAERVLAIRNIVRQRLTACVASSPSAPPKLADLVSRWGQLPSQLTVSQLEQTPDLEQTVLQLAYDTETGTASVCGPPAGDDALLLRIANNPSAVEQQ
jgi:tetratricopeptide (TPR) repeat protein